jgi:hypothetical protein
MCPLLTLRSCQASVEFLFKGGNLDEQFALPANKGSN